MGQTFRQKDFLNHQMSFLPLRALEQERLIQQRELLKNERIFIDLVEFGQIAHRTYSGAFQLLCSLFSYKFTP